MGNYNNIGGNFMGLGDKLKYVPKHFAPSGLKKKKGGGKEEGQGEEAMGGREAGQQGRTEQLYKYTKYWFPHPTNTPTQHMCLQRVTRCSGTVLASRRS